jgi:hypothetical protein
MGALELGVGGRQLAAAAAQLLGDLVVFQGATHDQTKLVVAPGLGDEVIDLAVVDGLDELVGVDRAGGQQAHHVGVGAAHLLEQIDARHLGHALIGHDDADGMAGQRAQGLVGGGSEVGVAEEGRVREDASHRAQQLRVVIHEQDVVAHCAHHSAAAVVKQGHARRPPGAAATCAAAAGGVPALAGLARPRAGAA